MENSILYSGINFGSRGPARIWAEHYAAAVRLLTAAFLPPFATYRVKNYPRGVGGAGVSYGPVLSNIYVNTAPTTARHTGTINYTNNYCSVKLGLFVIISRVPT